MKFMKIMNLLNNNTFIVVLSNVIIFSLFVYALNSYTYSGKQLVDTETAKQNIKANKYDVVLDVRTKLEYDIGHYPNSIHIPTTSITKQNVEKYIQNKNATILVYCNTGQRARYASELLENLGYKNVKYISETYKDLL